MENSIVKLLIKIIIILFFVTVLSAHSKFMEVYHFLNEVINYSHIALGLLL